MSNLKQILQNQSYAEIYFPIGADIIEQAIEAFLNFLQLPHNIKTHIDFSIAPSHRRGDVGYKHRDPIDHIYNDHKDFFHYHPEIFIRYKEFLQNHPEVNNFMLKAKPIWELTYIKLKEILNEFPMATEKVFDTDIPHIQLRFLRYNWQQSGKYLAKPHFDAGSCTLAIAESGPGLRIGSGPDDLKLVEHKQDHAIFMLSSNFRQMVNNDDISPGWHDVVQLDESKIGMAFARWAIVAFVDAVGVEALSKNETHKYYVYL
jgi:hypothetical protein